MGVMLITLKIDAKLEEKLTCCFKNDKNLSKIVLNARKSLKWKVFKVLPKRYRGVIFHNAEK